jgi:hypothetical protein
MKGLQGSQPRSSRMVYLALGVAGIVHPSGHALLRSAVAAGPSPRETHHTRRPGRPGPDHLRRPVPATRRPRHFPPVQARNSSHSPTSPTSPWVLPSSCTSSCVRAWCYEHQPPGLECLSWRYFVPSGPASPFFLL